MHIHSSKTTRPTMAFLTAALLLAASIVSAAPADFANSPKITLRVTSSSPAGMEDSKALTDTVEYLKNATNGTVVLQPFFSSSLFDEIAGMGAAQSGLIDMAVACTCNMTKQTDAMLFSDVPYLWRQMDNGRQVWSGPLGQKIQKDLSEKLGIVPVAFTPSGGGYRILWTNKRPVKVPADMKGVKIRTTATPIEQEFWKGMGAIPTPVDVKEIYTALQQGLVDSEHLQPVWLTLLKHDEVVKYGTEIDALAVYRMMVINQKSLAKMDAKQQEAFGDAMKFYEDKAYAYNRSLRDAAMQTIKAKGLTVYTPTAVEMAEWRKVGVDFMNSEVVTSRVPKQTIEQALAAQK